MLSSSTSEGAILFDPTAPLPSKLLVVFRERCQARALMVAEGMLDLHHEVDILQQLAVDQGLVAHYGQDQIQTIMTDAFKTGGRSWIV